MSIGSIGAAVAQAPQMVHHAHHAQGAAAPSGATAQPTDTDGDNDGSVAGAPDTAAGRGNAVNLTA